MGRPTLDLTLLRRHVAQLEPPFSRTSEVVSLGDPGLDMALPWRGLPKVGVHDIIGSVADAAADGFAMALAGRLAGGRGRVLYAGGWRCGLPYGPGLVRFGIDPDRLFLVAVHRPAELLWVMEEGLRGGALAVVIGDGAVADLTASRRLQLAAENGGSVALMLASIGGAHSSAALTRWRIAAAPSPDGAPGPRWRVALERCRGGRPGDWLVDWHDEAHRFTVVPPMADRRLALATA